MQTNQDRIDANAPTPIGQQLRAILLNQIEAGVYAPRRKVPSERVLAEQFGISRTSVREALTHLLSKGVLCRTVGRGTYVADVAEKRGQPKSRPVTVGQIGFWIDSDVFNFIQAGYNRILTGAGEICRQRGWRLQFHPVAVGGQSLDLILDEDVKSGGLDGNMVVGGLNHHELARLRDLGSPLLLVDLMTTNVETGTVRIDYASGVRAAVEHLRSLGHRSIGFIGFPGSEKYEAYWQSLEADGLSYNPRHVCLLSSTEPAPGMVTGYQAARKLAAGADLPTALIVTNDHVAIGAIEALTLAGIEVPEAMSVVGCDDLGEGTRALTTIRVDLMEVGRQAAKTLLDSIEHGIDPQIILMPAQLVVRGTTAVPSRVEISNTRS